MRYLLLSLFCCSLSLSLAAETAESIRIASAQVTPYGMNTPQGSAGIYYDLSSEIARQAGFSQIDNQLLPPARGLALSARGQYDMLIAPRHIVDALPAAIKDKLYPLESVGKLERAIYSLATTPINHLEDMAGKTVGRIIRTCPWLNDSAYLDVEKHDLTDMKAGLAMMRLGRLDALCASTKMLDRLRLQGVYAESELAPPLLVAPVEVWLYGTDHLSSQGAQRLKEAARKLAKLKRLEELNEYYVKGN